MSTASGPRLASTATSPDAPLLAIIGAGAAGLATGFYAQKAGLSFRILEGSSRAGGNAATLQHGPFRYDTGAHRWHNRYPDITADLQELLGNELEQIQVPSQIFSKGRFFDFPLSPLNLVRNLGLAGLAKAVADVLGQQFRPAVNPGMNFGQVAIRNYGRTLARRFLLGYSEKLWGAPANELSASVAGKRLKGLSLKTFLIEALKGSKAKTLHLDGSFYYPRQGIGTITEKVTAQLGMEAICFNQPVQKVYWHQNRITKIQLSNGTTLPVNELVSSLPLNKLVQALEPAPPARILELAGQLRFRHLLLVVLFLDRETVSPNASLYFPDPELPFTRLYEPRNRSMFMAPTGQTSVVVEIPTHQHSAGWQKSDQELIAETTGCLTRLGFFLPEQVLEGKVHRIPYAYPVLLNRSEEQVQELGLFLAGFQNLHLVGRAASFRYTHLHDHFRQAKSLVEKFKDQADTPEQNRPGLG